VSITAKLAWIELALQVACWGAAIWCVLWVL